MGDSSLSAGRTSRCPSGSPSRTIRPRRRRAGCARTAKSDGGATSSPSTALAGEAVAVEETEDGQWLVRFYDTAIGLIDTHKKKLRRLAVPADGDGEAQDEDKP